MEQSADLREGDFTFSEDSIGQMDEIETPSSEGVEEESDDEMMDEEEKPEVEVPDLEKGMRLYENTRKDYSIQYPKNWYYRSFGALNGTEWLVGFADKEVETVDDAIIFVIINDKEAVETPYGSYSTIVPRKADDIFYIVEGPKEMKEVIDTMAKSIK